MHEFRKPYPYPIDPRDKDTTLGHILRVIKW